MLVIYDIFTLLLEIEKTIIVKLINIKIWHKNWQYICDDHMDSLSFFSFFKYGFAHFEIQANYEYVQSLLITNLSFHISMFYNILMMCSKFKVSEMLINYRYDVVITL
jgi:hypothetical protein